jgi:hypothetical protein
VWHPRRYIVDDDLIRLYAFIFGKLTGDAKVENIASIVLLCALLHDQWKINHSRINNKALSIGAYAAANG